MSENDLAIRTAIESILESEYPRQGLLQYFADLPDKRIRRATSLLSVMYPDKTELADSDFSFILYMFSD